MQYERQHIWTAEDCLQCLPPRSGECNKGDFGYIALVAGSTEYSGAAKLANMAAAAMRSGAGVVKLAVPASIAHAVMPYLCESTLFPLSETDGQLLFREDEFRELVRNVRSVAFGMGCKTGKNTALALRYLLNNYDGDLVIDADGLNVLALTGTDILRGCRPHAVILTPHVREFSRLTGASAEDISANKADLARRFAAEHGVILLLKGSDTVVTDGDSVHLIKRGCAGMATAGSGDVLSGIIAALLGYSSHSVVQATAYVNGLAGEFAQQKTNSISMIASDTVSCIVQAITSIMYKSNA